MKKRTPTKAELARAYFPDVTDKTASELFRKMIIGTPGLVEELEKTGYNKWQKRFTPHQIDLLFARIGEP